MAEKKPLTPAQQTAALTRLAGRTTKAAEAQKKADAALQARDELATDLADAGVRYQDLAEAMDITPDGVTYVLRKVRQRRFPTGRPTT